MCVVDQFLCSNAFHTTGMCFTLATCQVKQNIQETGKFSDKSSRRRGLHSLENPFWLRTKAFLIHFLRFAFSHSDTLGWAFALIKCFASKRNSSEKKYMKKVRILRRKTKRYNQRKWTFQTCTILIYTSDKMPERFVWPLIH